MSIPVVILCGGEGTRLQSETEKMPKPLLQIGDRPMLHHIMDRYAKYGFDNISTLSTAKENDAEGW